MLRVTSLKNAHKRRTLQARYAQTQATPVDMVLDPTQSRVAQGIEGTPTTGITGNTLAAILPGMVAVKGVGRSVKVSGGTDTERAFGLFANFVGGPLDDLGDSNKVGVWNGVGSHWELLAPAFDDTNLATAAAGEDGTDEKEAYLRSNAKGQLAVVTPADPGQAFGHTARLIERLSSKAVIVQLLV